MLQCYKSDCSLFKFLVWLLGWGRQTCSFNIILGSSLPLFQLLPVQIFAESIMQLFLAWVEFPLQRGAFIILSFRIIKTNVMFISPLLKSCGSHHHFPLSCS